MQQQQSFRAARAAANLVVLTTVRMLASTTARAASCTSTPPPTPCFEGLGFLVTNTDSEPRGVSADGLTVVGDSAGQGFRWTAATGMVGLGAVPSVAFGVSGDGNVAAGQGK